MVVPCRILHNNHSWYMAYGIWDFFSGLLSVAHGRRTPEWFRRGALIAYLV